MIIGTCFLASTSENRDRFTPWFPRGADNAIFMFEEIYCDMGDGDYTINVYHKSAEDPGSSPGSPTTTATSLTGTGFTRIQAVGLKELVRFKISVVKQEDNPGSSLVFRFLSPVWYATAKA
jgi:hypothetical protein